MPKISIDGIEYNSEDLTDNGKAQLASLQFLEVYLKNRGGLQQKLSSKNLLKTHRI